ncbi:MAG TPA: GNAT family N-acetyltransferase [Thermoplasmata archaeon]
MAPEALEYSTKELTKDTLPDFERLFEKHPAPGAFMCWCMYHQRARPLAVSKQQHSRVKEAARNRQQKRELVENGRSHGILVYSKGEPVGWCQYGSREELPRLDSDRSYRRLAPEGDMKRLWRITCFVVDKKYRERGVASAALKAALEAIRSKGGGLVEAYPIIRWGAYREYLGTVSMFQKEGFKIVAPFGKSNVVMRRKL